VLYPAELRALQARTDRDGVHPAWFLALPVFAKTMVIDYIQ
jgi:hypothetical protein